MVAFCVLKTANRKKLNYKTPLTLNVSRAVSGFECTNIIERTVNELAHGYIYLITNLVNDKKYVGLTTRHAEERFKEHCHADSHLGRAIRKYGKSSFELEIIDEANDQQELADKEMYWIKFYETYSKRGYNQTVGGFGIFRPKLIATHLTEKQKRFVGFVTENNRTKTNVSNPVAMTKAVLLNLMQVFLIAENESDKRNAANLIDKLKPELKEQVFKMKVISPVQVTEWL